MSNKKQVLWVGLFQIIDMKQTKNVQCVCVSKEQLIFRKRSSPVRILILELVINRLLSHVTRVSSVSKLWLTVNSKQLINNIILRWIHTVHPIIQNLILWWFGAQIDRITSTNTNIKQVEKIPLRLRVTNSQSLFLYPVAWVCWYFKNP